MSTVFGLSVIVNISVINVVIIFIVIKVIFARGGGKPDAMDRRMDTFAHGGHDGLDGGVRDASAGKTKTNDKRQTTNDKRQTTNDKRQYQLP